MFLKTKEKNLESEVNNLRETIKIQLFEIEKPLRNTNLTDKV